MLNNKKRINTIININRQEESFNTESQWHKNYTRNMHINIQFILILLLLISVVADENIEQFLKNNFLKI